MLQIMQELAEPVIRSLNLNGYTAAGIGNKTAQMQPLGQVVHEGTKPDTLDNTVDQQAQSLNRRGCR